MKEHFSKYKLSYLILVTGVILNAIISATQSVFLFILLAVAFLPYYVVAIDHVYQLNAQDRSQYNDITMFNWKFYCNVFKQYAGSLFLTYLAFFGLFLVLGLGFIMGLNILIAINQPALIIGYIIIATLLGIYLVFFRWGWLDAIAIFSPKQKIGEKFALMKRARRWAGKRYIFIQLISLVVAIVQSISTISFVVIPLVMAFTTFDTAQTILPLFVTTFVNFYFIYLLLSAVGAIIQIYLDIKLAELLAEYYVAENIPREVNL